MGTRMQAADTLGVVTDYEEDSSEQEDSAL